MERIGVIFDVSQMSTAIVKVYTPEGFVIAADGRLLNTLTGDVKNDSVQKIFEVDGFPLAYSMTGTCLITSDDEREVVWDLRTAIASRIAPIIRGKRRDLYSVGQLLSREVNKALEETRLSGNLKEYPTERTEAGERGSTVAEVQISGYLLSNPSSIRIRFLHEDQKLCPPQIYSVACSYGYEVIGSKKVLSILRDRNDTRLKDYGKLSIDAFTLDDGLRLARMYIRACSSDEARELDPLCKTIGGDFQSATISPSHGFSWSDRPSSLK